MDVMMIVTEEAVVVAMTEIEIMTAETEVAGDVTGATLVTEIVTAGEEDLDLTPETGRREAEATPEEEEEAAARTGASQEAEAKHLSIMKQEQLANLNQYFIETLPAYCCIISCVFNCIEHYSNKTLL